MSADKNVYRFHASMDFGCCCSTYFKNRRCGNCMTDSSQRQTQKRHTASDSMAGERGGSVVHLAEFVDDRKRIDGVPDHGFRVGLDHVYPEKGKPLTIPRLKQIPSFLGLSFRYMKRWNEIRKQGKKMFIDIRDAVPCQQIYGVPLGGIGCGSIGRGFRGEFGRFQMIPGMYKWKTIPADQFTVTIRKNNRTVYQNVLSSHSAPKKRLTAWKWQFDGSKATYHGLYPRAWTVYEIPEYQVRLLCKQISPIIPHDYKESSLPVAVFEWEIENKSSEVLDISITFTFQTAIGRRRNDLAGGMWNESFSYQSYSDSEDCCVSGVKIHQKLNDMACTFLISAKHKDGVHVTQSTFFDPEGSGSSIWLDLEEDGKLETGRSPSPATSPGKQSAGAVCAQVHSPANSHRTAELCLAWDMPKVKFGGGESAYTRRYVRWFAGDLAGEKLCAHALTSYPLWKQKIEEWQNPVLKSSLPSWYKSALFNELYFVSDGGTVWLDEVHDDVNSQHYHQITSDYGKFAYLEGHEYRMYNTYDVHFYASFALAMNWPKLQLSLQYDMAEAINQCIPTEITFCMDGKVGPIKEKHCVPHDIGDPEDEPWKNINCYSIHPTADWKDLNPKFVLQVMRDYHITKDYEYLCDMFPSVKTVMEKTKQFDTDGDGMIENGGYADQTYDTWTATGTSAYCGSLWLAAMRCYIEICQILDKPEEVGHYKETLKKAAESYDAKLWNGSYYNYDSSKNSHREHIMSDQLCGRWYLKACGIQDSEVFPDNKVKSALQAVFDNNVMRFGNGRMGAINGCKPNGKADRTTVQSEEFWTGTTYALAASLVQEGMLNQAFQTSHGVYSTVYEERGLAYQTPEAYMEGKIYRALGYMRPLSIWSIQWAIEQYHKELLNGTKLIDKCCAQEN